jgi:hypothetical protein
MSDNERKSTIEKKFLERRACRCGIRRGLFWRMVDVIVWGWLHAGNASCFCGIEQHVTLCCKCRCLPNSKIALTSHAPRSTFQAFPMSAYDFKPFKHNALVAAIAKPALRLRTRELEKLIFTATTGRSGTLTLTRLFAAVPGCVAVHEAPPIMNGPVLEAANYGNAALMDRVYRQVKSINILRASIGHRYYMEANHLFIKTFFQQATRDFGDRLTVIHLVRPAIEVATSIYRLRNYPGTEQGNYWWLDYRAPSNLIQIADALDFDAEFSHPFYKALWYWYEVESRISAWRAQMPSLKIVRFETDWLNDAEKVFELFDALGVDYDRQIVATKVGIHEHDKEQQKMGPALPSEQAQEMHSLYRKLLANRRLQFC